jgi:hypothetical protein
MCLMVRPLWPHGHIPGTDSVGGRGFGARSFAIEELRARFGLDVDEDEDGAGTRDGEASSWNMARVAGRA